MNTDMICLFCEKWRQKVGSNIGACTAEAPKGQLVITPATPQPGLALPKGQQDTPQVNFQVFTFWPETAPLQGCHQWLSLLGEELASRKKIRATLQKEIDTQIAMVEKQGEVEQ